MGRGLSKLQKRILGLAFSVNVYTQGGQPSIKTGPKVDDYKIPALAYRGPVDYVTPLGVFLLYGITPAETTTRRDPRYGEVEQGIGTYAYFANTPEVKAAKAGASRAITRIVERCLMAYRPWTVKGERLGAREGYLLTAEGLEIGRDNVVDLPNPESTLMHFHVVDQPLNWRYRHGGGREPFLKWAEKWCRNHIG